MPEIPLPKQIARCALTSLALGKVMLFLPEIEGTKKEKAVLERVVKWQILVMDLCPMEKLPNFNAGALLKKLAVIENYCCHKKADPHKVVAGLWACALLVSDVHVTCKDIGRAQPWYRLNNAVDALGRIFLSRYEGADQAGDELYLKIAW